jgi:hypothetical protein
MSLRAIIDNAAYEALPDTSVIGKDSFKKNEKDNQFYLNLQGEEAAKLAMPLQEKVTKLEANNQKLLDEKIKTAAKVTAFEKLGKTPEELEQFLKDNKTEDAAALEAKYKTQMESVRTSAQAEIDSVKIEYERAQTTNRELTDQIREQMKRTIVAELKTEFDMNALGDDYLANRIAIVPEEEGSNKFVVRVIEDGKEAFKGGALKTPKELAEEARQNRDLAGMFNGGTGGGSGGHNNQGGGGSRKVGTVLASDQAGMTASLEQIASGEVKVVD